MSSEKNSLETMMRETLDEGGYVVAGSREQYMEVIDSETGLVWMSAAPVEMADFENLEIDKPLAKVGIAYAPMDSAAFVHSPGAPDEPVRERIINGRLYINVATPREQIPPVKPGGPAEISVEKAHVIGFEAGRSVVVLSLPEGDFVELVGNGTADESLVLPEGGELRRVEITEPWVVCLPNPTRTFFWFGNGIRSFQGPVILPGSQ